MKNSRLEIYAYVDFREFIKDRLDELKELDSRNSRRFFIRRLGLSSSNYLARIIDGRRNLSNDLASRLASELGLNRSEIAFFFDLVRYGQSKSKEAKYEALKILRRNSRFVKVNRMSLDHIDYMSSPFLLALREMVDIAGFKEDTEWIYRRLKIKVEKSKIIQGISILVESGLIERDENGKLKAADKHQITGNQLGSIALRQYHRQMIANSLEAMSLPVDIRHYLGMTMSIPAGIYDQIVEEMLACRSRIRAMVDEAEKTDCVYHIEMSLCPLSRPVQPAIDESEQYVNSENYEEKVDNSSEQ